MSSQQFQGFQSRTITAENMVKSLQEQLTFLQKQLQNKQSNRKYNSSSNESKQQMNNNDSNTFQPDNTYPVWYTPYTQSQSNRDDNIMVINSLCPSTKVPFIPKNGKLIKWYTCGPTVYAPSHMGHARTYITFDIIRNVLEYYFGYKVNLVMNITDVDDKIILRARQNYLFKNYVSENSSNPNKIITDIDAAFQSSLAQRETAVANGEIQVKNAVEKHKKDMQENLLGQQVKLENVRSDYKRYTTLKESDNRDMKAVFSVSKSVLSEWLDTQFGNTVKDQRIFRAHAEAFEKEFFEDMRQLNVRDPDVLTRVTEYVPEIIAFVQKLIANGYGYESNGSVYFDIEKYRQKHDYPKLDPKKLDNKLLMDEGEGSLASQTIDKERKSHRDFALWKKSKSGEPQWESPWGYGRPGWHIECSTMAAQILGDNMDIHTGGEDLKFPHHDNEMAQSSAFYSDPNSEYYHQQWVNYWFHAGHLHIGGLKMSKSLKNFITIRQALEMSTTRQIRLLFLLQSWYGKMNYSDDSIEETQAKEHQIEEFFLLISALNRKYNSSKCVSSTPYLPSNTMDSDLNQAIMDKQVLIDQALRDNFDYVTATQLLFDLISDINTYVKNLSESVPNILLLNKTASFVNHLLKIFGVVPQNETFFLGSKQIENEAYLQSVLDIITEYRADLVGLFRNKSQWKEYDSVVQGYQSRIGAVNSEEKEEKSVAMNVSEIVLRKQNLYSALVVFDANVSKLTKDLNKDSAKALIRMTDELRDVILPKFGVKIEDIEGGKGSIWKLYEPNALLKLLKSMNAKKDNKKLRNKEKQLRKDLDAWNKKSIKPEELFQTMSDNKGNLMYSQFDSESGLPTHDAQNKELSKKKSKKLPKLLKKQQTMYDSYQQKVKENPNFLKDLQNELEKVQNELKQ